MRVAEVGRQAGVTLLVAAGLLAATTSLRAVLTPELGAQSPFMLYVAAVVLAGVLRGAFCGALVMLGGGASGLFLFLEPGGVSEPGLIALVVFWLVSSVVLAVANELRLGVKATFDRVQAIARRRQEEGAH